MRTKIPILWAIAALHCGGKADRGVTGAFEDLPDAAPPSPSPPASSKPEPGHDPPLCFVGNTPVATPWGPVAIEALRVGDVVMAYDETAHEIVHGRVLATMRFEDREVGGLRVDGGRVLGVTPDHPVYLPRLGKYVPVKEVPVDEALLSFDAEVTQVLAAGYEAQLLRAAVYNITVAAHHNYFAGGVLVHNKPAPPCPTYDWSTGTGCGPEFEPPLDCVIAHRLDTCCEAPIATDRRTLAWDECLVEWGVSAPLDLQERCAARVPTECRSLRCASQPPVSRVVQGLDRRCEFVDECVTDADCIVGLDHSRCCPCPESIPASLVGTACYSAEGEAPRRLCNTCPVDCDACTAAPAVSCMLTPFGVRRCGG